MIINQSENIKEVQISLTFYLVPLFFLMMACCGFIACQTPYRQAVPQKNLTYRYTGWPEKSVERLLFQYLDSKSRH